jgi:phospholipid-binding lipoprotein MlaA
MKIVRLVVVVGFAVVLSACASLEGPDYGVYDTSEGLNRSSYRFTDRLDRAIIVPVANAYQALLPDFVETGIANFFRNLRDLDSALNGFLQGKPKRGATDVARFVLNSTIGLGGLFDVATSADLRSQEEDLGQTLAVWGWKNSRYIYVPFLGPATIRDLPSLTIRGYVPRLVVGSGYSFWLGGLDLLNTRANALTLTDARDVSALDPYAFTREAYYQRRKYLIFDGDLDEETDDFFDEFEEE